MVILYIRFLNKRAQLRTQIEVERYNRQKSKEVDDLKSRFYTNISHEFRTPLTLISGPVSHLLDKKSVAEEDKNELRFKEMQKQLEDQKKLTEEMKRKQEQGSMQLQGEVQELAIEEWLASKFPLDTIEEIKKGVRGGDCIQIVHSRTEQNCGTIYYESKRTKDFQPSWIEKFKADIRDRGANIGVLAAVCGAPDHGGSTGRGQFSAFCRRRGRTRG